MANRPSAVPHPSLTQDGTFRQHWPLYLCEAAELALFMLSACAFTVWLYDPTSHLAQAITNPWLRRAIMGSAMGLTAILIIHSPMGKISGAHFNPAITLTYLRLGKIHHHDALFYTLFQFLGGLMGVALSALIFGPRLALPTVNYAVTVPGIFGTPGAFAAELFMAALLMATVLYTGRRPALSNLTSYAVGVLISLYIFFLAPISGFSINPARTTASAIFAHIFTAFWLYFVAPPLGMLLAAQLHQPKSSAP